jgi:hypothetical protein
MIKRLDMVHLKMIWYNALVEISQAHRVVFVGYSAPPADYEVRYMLAKAFASGDRGRDVQVVTAPEHAESVRQNYQRLLGGTVQVSTEGVEGLVNKIVAGSGL